MIVGIVLCPHPPLLLPELTGSCSPVPALRAACTAAMSWLVDRAPEVITILGAGEPPGSWPPDADIDTGRFGGRLRRTRRPDTEPRSATLRPQPRSATLPLSVGVAARLLDEAGWRGARQVMTISPTAGPADCAAAGTSLVPRDSTMGLVVAADGSARRGPRAPGHLDDDAAPFDSEVLTALRTADTAALQRVDPGRAERLLAQGRPAWQALAGALDTYGAGWTVTIDYADDPYGVFYVVARFAPADQDLR